MDPHTLDEVSELKKPRQTEVRSQITVVIKGTLTSHVINPQDEVTQGSHVVEYPDDVLTVLSDPDDWLDLWQDEVNDAGERTKMAIRLFGRNVLFLTQAFIFPDGEDMLQS